MKQRVATTPTRNQQGEPGEEMSLAWMGRVMNKLDARHTGCRGVEMSADEGAEVSAEGAETEYKIMQRGAVSAENTERMVRAKNRKMDRRIGAFIDNRRLEPTTLDVFIRINEGILSYLHGINVS